MPSSPFVFTGHPAYLEAAAEQLGRPEHARAAGRLAALSALANLCAQASRVDPADVAPILAKAGEFRDQIAIALRAADAMIADVGSARQPEAKSASAEVVTPSHDSPLVSGRLSQKRTSRRKRGRS